MGNGRVTGTNWNVLENNKTSERVPGPRLRRQLNVNNCLNPNDKHLLSWISRLQTGCQGCQGSQSSQEPQKPKHCQRRVNERQKKYCEWHKKKKKKTLRFSFSPAHTFFAPIGLWAGKRFKFNRQSVWSAAHLGTATDQDHHEEEVGAVFACCVLCVQLICTQFG